MKWVRTMLSAPDKDQIPETGSRPKEGAVDLWAKTCGVVGRLRAAPNWLTVGFGISLSVYLIIKLVGVVTDLPRAADLTAVPAGVCALGLAVSHRRTAAREDAAADEGAVAMRPALLAAGLLVAFTLVYLTVNTVPFASSQDESAIINGGHSLATSASLQATSPLSERYNTNIVGNLHVTYRTATEMYYLTFPGTAVLYAPLSELPGDLGYRVFTAAFGVLAIIALYGVALKLLNSVWGAFAAAFVFAVSPVFGHWAVQVINNVPVLALELSALAVVLWSPRDSPLEFAVAGALAGAACFARVTELVLVAPIFVLVVWRARGLQPRLAFLGASLAGVALIALTNQILFGDPLFIPHVGSQYIFPGAAQTTPSLVVTRYAQLSTGTGGGLHFELLTRLDNMWFHVRYLASATFAFPFIAVALVGLAWRIVAGKRNGWLLISIFLVTVGVVLVVYGQKYNNYYGFGQPIVRSSVIRYSLPIYAMLAVGAGAFFLDARRLFVGRMASRVIPLALLAVVGVVGVARSYDAEVYGFNQLNAYRESDRAAWNDIETFLDNGSASWPLLIGGPNVEKLIDSKYQPYFITYYALPATYRWGLILAVAQQAAQERDVYIIASDANRTDKNAVLLFYSLYRPTKVLGTHNFSVYRLSFEPPNYRLGYVDVWNTYGALDRWSVTSDGYLQATGDNSYVQLPIVDANGDGRLDYNLTLRFEMLDSGPSVATIYGLEPGEGGQRVPLWTSPLGQTETWRTATVELHKGESLQGLLVVSRGVTLRRLGVAATGP